MCGFYFVIQYIYNLKHINQNASVTCGRSLFSFRHSFIY